VLLLALAKDDALLAHVSTVNVWRYRGDLLSLLHGKYKVRPNRFAMLRAPQLFEQLERALRVRLAAGSHRVEFDEPNHITHAGSAVAPNDTHDAASAAAAGASSSSPQPPASAESLRDLESEVQLLLDEFNIEFLREYGR